MDARFFIPTGGPYFLSHSVGPLTALGQSYLADKYLNPLKQRGGDAWPDWLGFMDEFSDALAEFLGGNAADYCPQVNLSSGLTKFLTALPAPTKRREILMHSFAFPSMGFVVQALAGRGYQLKLIPDHLSPIDPQVWADQITDETAAIFITHAYSNTGQLSPVKTLIDLARANDVSALVDIAQSAGVIPINMSNWNADAVFGSSVKWLCGGPGAGYMWINPDTTSHLIPEDVGWFSHENPFEFDIRNLKLAPNAKRFLGGTPSVAPYAMALGGLKTLSEIGIETIRAHNLLLLKILSPDLDPDTQSGTLSFDAGSQIDNVAKTLSDIGCRFDHRGTRLRLSPHIFTTEADAHRVAEILRSV